MGLAASLQLQDRGSIPSLAQWVKGSSVTTAGSRLGSNPWLRNSTRHKVAKKKKKKKMCFSNEACFLIPFFSPLIPYCIIIITVPEKY